MHGHARHRIVLAAAHLESAIAYCALDQQPSRLNRKRPKKVHALQRSSWRRRCAGHLKVRRTREEDTALHDVISHERVDSTRGRRAEHAHPVHR